ncbi:hypothetical protein ABE237_17480 [Brevibacillus formosus]|uniref:hypothetical protein n=1 Tax=Brevibacillus TaxID=55080 RepID=UPI000D0E874A|nr:MULTISPECIES: hypothetical protein [Brevibacillus]MBG9944471.1 hypothetical protein [Brevibacillus formosus]MED1946364.1 hypothetical protein [Brevibacillus formosus]MED1998714.1 hypothetical protein [Brevibacillus formosus]MED2084229.1 hypothetical protein [Brevibacillus formosus]PSK18256.1 hypothetical protein C7R94_13930 [Brevibacillus sp. NRRL NRS-603]
MDENRWLTDLKKRADQTIFRDVQFTATMEERVRQKVRPGTRWVTCTRKLALPGVVLTMGLLLWFGLPIQEERQSAQHEGRPSQQETQVPSLLPGGQIVEADLWKLSPSLSSTYHNQSFSYLGEKPVRIMTDQDGFYEGQTQRVIWLLNGDYSQEVEITAYNTDGARLSLGSYEVMDSLYDADGHFPSGIVLPEPGKWKLEVRSGGKHLGQVFVEVKKGIASANRQLVGPIIQQYLEKESDKLEWLGKQREMNVELLGVEAPDAAKRTVYAWVKITGSNSTALSAPMVFQIVYNGNAYQVTDFQIPEDGSNYQRSLQKLFPPKVLEQVHSRSKTK